MTLPPFIPVPSKISSYTRRPSGSCLLKRTIGIASRINSRILFSDNWSPVATHIERIRLYASTAELAWSVDMITWPVLPASIAVIASAPRISAGIIAYGWNLNASFNKSSIVIGFGASFVSVWTTLFVILPFSYWAIFSSLVSSIVYILFFLSRHEIKYARSVVLPLPVLPAIASDTPLLIHTGKNSNSSGVALPYSIISLRVMTFSFCRLIDATPPVLLSTHGGMSADILTPSPI